MFLCSRVSLMLWAMLLEVDAPRMLTLICIWPRWQALSTAEITAVSLSIKVRWMVITKKTSLDQKVNVREDLAQLNMPYDWHEVACIMRGVEVKDPKTSVACLA